MIELAESWIYLVSPCQYGLSELLNPYVGVAKTLVPPKKCFGHYFRGFLISSSKDITGRSDSKK